MTTDELKAMPKGDFILMKTGKHPMKTRFQLFLKWGISFDKIYQASQRTIRNVSYVNVDDLENYMHFEKSKIELEEFTHTVYKDNNSVRGGVKVE
jgi:type IV secretion system protein VirD4